MLVLGLETTCDETACALVRDGHAILSNVVASQAALHEPFGGVFPELACRRHSEDLLPVVRQALQEAAVRPQQVELIAVARGPGLIGALLVGLHAAKGLSLAWNVPFVGVNHVEAHLYAALMGRSDIPLPALGVVVSGGHTFLAKIEEVGAYTLIGTTVDDAIGEAFDKVAAMLALPYPGGPAIERLAQQGDPSRYPFKTGNVKGRPWDFSFSGLKTTVLYTVRGERGDKILPDEERAHVAASFQEAALSGVVRKASRAAAEFSCRAIVVGGGVSNNRRLRALFASQDAPVYFPPSGLSLDNAAMIAGLGCRVYQKQGEGDPLTLEPMTRISL
jgi:N6-L-threonylcarbamoyladenine synthase